VVPEAARGPRQRLEAVRLQAVQSPTATRPLVPVSRAWSSQDAATPLRPVDSAFLRVMPARSKAQVAVVPAAPPVAAVRSPQPAAVRFACTRPQAQRPE